MKKILIFAFIVFSLNCGASEICGSRDQIDAVRMLGELEGENNRSILAFLDLSDLILDVIDKIERSGNEEYLGYLDRVQGAYLDSIISSIEIGRERGYRVVPYKPRIESVLDGIREKAKFFPTSFESIGYKKLADELRKEA